MSTTPTESPRFLGRYELVHPLGQGGMGEVFLAKIHGAAGFEKPCIIKTVLPTLLKDRQFLDRFHHEAKVLVHLVHSSIAQVYDMGEADGTYFMALEYVAGVDLAFLLEQARTRGVPVPVPVALFIGQRMAEGLGYAHRKAGPDGAPLGIVHRDVSPHNVMVSYEGEVKVIDFGLAKSAARSKYTLPSTVMGKLGYMSPEQVRAEALDHRSDIYSCGVVLWEMLAGRPLIRHGTVGEMMAAMSQPVVPELPGLRPDVDAALDAVVRRALGAKPDERYARSDELARALTGELLRTGASVGAEEVGQFVRTLCPEAFEAQRQLIAKVTSASGHRRTPTPGTGYGTGQQPAAPVSGFEPTMMRGLDGTPRGEAASSTVHVEGLEAVDPGATAPRKPSRPVPTAGQEAALEPAASRKRPMGLYAAIAVLLVIATAATTALFVRQPAAPVAAVEPASPASPGAPPSGTASAEGTASAGPTAGSASPGVSPTGSVSAGVPPTGAASGGSTAAGTASAGSTAAGSTGSSASAVGTASAASSGTGTPATGTPAAGTPDTQDGTVVPATAQGTQVAAAVPSAGSALPDDDRTSAHPTRTPPRKKPAVQPVRHISPKRPVQASEAAEAADAVTPEAPAVDAGTPAPAKPEVVKLDGYAKKKGGVAGFVGDHITVRNPSTQDWTGCWVVKDQRKASYLGNVKSTEEQSTVRKFTQHPTLEVGSGMVGVFCNEGSFTQKLE